jgi:hypothetical protein
MRNRPFLDRKAALARLLRATEAGILFNEHIAEDGPCTLRIAWRMTSPCSGTGARSESTPAARTGDDPKSSRPPERVVQDERERQLTRGSNSPEVTASREIGKLYEPLIWGHPHY